MLGLPGAPGCTTTGCEAEAVCAVRDGEASALPGAFAGTASTINSSSAGPHAARRLRSRVRGMWWSFRCGASPNIFNFNALVFDTFVRTGRGKVPDTEMRLTPSKSPGIFAELGPASITPEATRERALNITCCVIYWCRPIGVACEGRPTAVAPNKQHRPKARAIATLRGPCTGAAESSDMRRLAGVNDGDRFAPPATRYVGERCERVYSWQNPLHPARNEYFRRKRGRGRLLRRAWDYLTRRCW